MIDYKLLARQISVVENGAAGYEDLLKKIRTNDVPVIGFTGPPGAGKSTLLNAVVGELLRQEKRIGLLLIDPSSPFNFGAILGDRLRLSSFFNHPNLFIRSVASRGSLGGLSDAIIEITEVMKSYAFDYIFVETVGVGQSEVEIAGLADTTVVVLVPEAGDGVQAMKAGLMEIADVFVINKADRSDADALMNALKLQLEIGGKSEIDVIKTVAVEAKGVEALIQHFSAKNQKANSERHIYLLTEKVKRIVQKRRMKKFDAAEVRKKISAQIELSQFNLYALADEIERGL